MKEILLKSKKDNISKSPLFFLNLFSYYIIATDVNSLILYVRCWGIGMNVNLILIVTDCSGS